MTVAGRMIFLLPLAAAPMANMELVPPLIRAIVGEETAPAPALQGEGGHRVRRSAPRCRHRPPTELPPDPGYQLLLARNLHGRILYGYGDRCIVRRDGGRAGGADDAAAPGPGTS